ncbi:hypothetical protein [Chromatocurvus halotolerans]|uniref:Uncharacterized protein n=1 Tax=Chromatocurvus halotolerans TaxID=1132028 RepID=A0A4R2KM56_9GAMM|nr:hypothetical protein [Chromatocurvus halotolerans]TCO75161.1 hypothetical protein EV688_110116 [Chromatocurvus halotolerans]
MPHSLSVEADFSLEAADGTTLHIESDSDRVTVHLPDFRTARENAGLYRDKATRVKALHRLQRGLQISDLTLDIVVRQHRVACLAPDSRGSWLSLWMGLGNMALFPMGMLRALLIR